MAATKAPQRGDTLTLHGFTGTVDTVCGNIVFLFTAEGVVGLPLTGADEAPKQAKEKQNAEVQGEGLK